MALAPPRGSMITLDLNLAAGSLEKRGERTTDAMRSSLATLFLVTIGVTLITLMATVEVSGERGRGSVSIGHPNKGKLWNGARLPEKGRGFYSNPARPNGTAVWGTDEMIDLLKTVGAEVDGRAPGATLYINDIGFFEGGRISHHHSHRAGRDADLLFYMFDVRGEVAAPVCIPFDGEGRATWDSGTPADPSDDQEMVFDTRRNWAVVRSLVEHDEGNVQRIYLSEALRELLLGHARDHGEPAWVIERADELMCEPGSPHDDHFHVRIFCSAEDYRRGCRDAWPMYPWRRTELALLGIPSPKLVRSSRGRSSKRTHGPPPRPPEGERLWCP